MGWRRSCMMACAAAVLSCATTPADVDREDRVCHAAVDTEEAAAAGGSANRGCGCGVNKLKRSLEDLFGTGHKGTTHKAHDGKGRRSGGATEDMVLIEGGRFFMGTDSPIIHGDGEGPARPVVLSSFYIDRFAVPNRDFEVFIQTTKYETDNEKFGWSFVFEGLLSPDALKKIDKAVAGAEWWVPVKDVTWRSPEGPESDVFSSDRENHPVVQVTWNDAKAFCEWRGARLPTEAEWEYAALGGRRGGTLFPWGNTLQPSGEHKANIWQGTFPKQNMVDDGYYGTCPVDALGPQNDYGLYNMIGNVWEWVADTWTTTHSREEQVNPKGPPEGQEKTKKGGSFLCHKSYCYRYRVAARHHTTADSATSNNGFRCAKDGPSEDEEMEET